MQSSVKTLQSYYFFHVDYRPRNSQAKINGVMKKKDLVGQNGKRASTCIFLPN